MGPTPAVLIFPISQFHLINDIASQDKRKLYPYNFISHASIIPQLLKESIFILDL